MHRLGPQLPACRALVFARSANVRFNSTIAPEEGEPTKPKPVRVTQWGNIKIPSQEDVLKKRNASITYSPDLSYLQNASSRSLAGRLAQGRNRVSSPSNPGTDAESAAKQSTEGSAKRRKEERLAREAAATNTRETSAKAELDKLVGEQTPRSGQRAFKPIQIFESPVEEVSMAIKNSNLNAEFFDTLSPAMFDSGALPVGPNLGRSKPLSTSAQKRKEERLSREKHRPRQPAQPLHGRPSTGARKRRPGLKQNASARKENPASLPDSITFEGEIIEGEEHELSEDEKEMLPYQPPPEYSGPTPVSLRLFDTLKPSALQPVVVVPGERQVHPISRQLVSSFVGGDYSRYVPADSSVYNTPPSRASASKYAQCALAHNASIPFEARKYALDIIAQSTKSSQLTFPGGLR